MRFRINHLLLGAALLVFSPAYAQDGRTVTVSDGIVTINGEVLPDDAVPQALREFDGEVSFTFLGDEDPVIGFGESLYRIEGNRIVEVPAVEGGAGPGVFRLNVDGLHDLDHFQMNFPTHVFDPGPFRDHVVSIVRAESLAVAHAREMAQEHQVRLQSLADEMRRSVPPPGGRVRVFHGPAPGDESTEARWMDPLENERLRGHLDRERALDQESQRIAQELRQIASEELRRELERDLREHLEEVFELRQENRRTEIRELESRLEELKQRLERREELREEIVEERLEFLLDEDRPDRGR